MTAFSKMKMSYCKSAIMVFLKGGHYAGKGHYNHESKGAEAVKHNP